MDTQENIHIPFAQLVPQLRFIYSLAVVGAVLSVSPYLAAIQIEASNIEFSRVWDYYMFTPADALAFFENSERLEPFLVHFAVKDPRFWCPRLATRTSHRGNRK